MLKNARIKPQLNIEPEEWSLHELLHHCNVTAKAQGLKNPHEYVNKLAGWVNQLNKPEFRQHLYCRYPSCHKRLYPDMEYAKKMARYSLTIWSCKCGKPHDQLIYINHCWGCINKIIDSREDCIKVDGYYICLSCGSGPEEYKSNDEDDTTNKRVYYSQGDVCPACGTLNMEEKTYKKNYQRTTFICRNKDCQHQILAPEARRLTGLAFDKSVRLAYLQSRIVINCKKSEKSSDNFDFIPPSNMGDIPF